MQPTIGLGSGECASSGNPTATRGASEPCSWTRTAAPSSCSRSRVNGKWQRHELGNGGQHARHRLEGDRNIMTVTQILDHLAGLYEACQRLCPIDSAYANLPIEEGFNWSSCLGDARFEGLYLVVFRSVRRAAADLALLM